MQKARKAILKTSRQKAPIAIWWEKPGYYKFRTAYGNS